MFHEHYQLTTDPVGINQHLKAQIYDLRRKFEYCSPILTIQKTVRRFIYRKRYLRKRKMIVLFTWGINRWHYRYWVERMLKNMDLTRELLYQLGRVRFIQKEFRKLLKKWRLQERISMRAQSIFRMKRVQDDTID